MDRKLWMGAAVLFAASAALMLLHGARAPKAVANSPSLQLRPTNMGDRLRVEWNPLTDAVQRANSATLEVNDGGHVVRYPVDMNVIRSGKLDYLWHADDVLLSLKLAEEGKPAAVGMVRAVRAPAPAPAVVAPPPSAPVQTGQRARRHERPRARRR